MIILYCGKNVSWKSNKGGIRVKKYWEVAACSPLFRGISGEDLEQVLQCLNAGTRRYPAGSVILSAGERAEQVGLVLEGRVQVVREEFSGSRTLLTELVPGELFAETFACAPGDEKVLPVTVASVTESAALLLDYRRIVRACPNACPFHTRLIENMLEVLAEKNMALNRRLVHLSRRSTREKLLSYLEEQAALYGRSEFTIPFDRQELADYLCVDRSAMSTALSSLQAEGILKTRRNWFQLNQGGDGPDIT